MTITEEIVEKVQVLPEEKQKEILQFVKNIEIQVKPKQRLKIFEQIDKITGQVPKESWAELPTDGSENVDEYLYGETEKK